MIQFVENFLKIRIPVHSINLSCKVQMSLDERKKMFEHFETYRIPAGDQLRCLLSDEIADRGLDLQTEITTLFYFWQPDDIDDFHSNMRKSLIS